MYSVKNLGVKTAKKILSLLLSNHKSEEGRMMKVLEYHTGYSREKLNETSRKNRVKVFELVCKTVNPSSNKPVRHTYINSDGTLLELDLDTKVNQSDLKWLKPETSLTDAVYNMEEILSIFVKRFRRQAYKPMWVDVTERNRSEVVELLGNASWKQVIESFLYVCAGYIK